MDHRKRTTEMAREKIARKAGDAVVLTIRQKPS
jgi:hypothetical protein